MQVNRLDCLIFFAFCFLNTAGYTTYTCDPTASCGCSIAPTSTTSRIVGGEAAQANAWGWAAQLFLAGWQICGAVLISNEYALTAAHCLKSGTLPSQLTLIVGTNYLNDSLGTGEHREIIEYYIHPNFNDTTSTNDIAVLHFSPLTSSNVKFICLPSANVDSFTVGSDVVAIGWGTLTETSYGLSTMLQQVTVQIVSSTSADCQRVPIRDPNIELCAGVSGGGKDTCRGDSGGPLMYFTNNQWILVGITSSGQGCARPGYPGVYTRVSAFISFIEYVINFHGVTDGLSTTTSLVPKSSPSPVGVNHATNLGHFMYLLFVCLFMLYYIE